MTQTDRESWTVGRLLEWTTDFLRQRGADSPRLDAEVLLAHSLKRERIMLYACFGEEVDEESRSRFRDLVKRRGAGTPVAYLLGEREFFSLDFEVTPATLIPRPETEGLVVETVDRVKAMRKAGTLSPDVAPRIVDVGTGSGCIAVTLAKHLSDADLTAIDLSADALAVAKRNAERHGVAERIDFLEGDLLAPVSSEKKFDVVVSNPPYVSEAEFEQLARDVKDAEPKTALVAGPTGTERIDRLIPQAAERLRPDRWLLIELSPMIADAVRDSFDDAAWSDVELRKDMAGHARIVVAKRR